MFLLLFAWKFSQLWQNYRKHEAHWTWLTNVLRILWLPGELCPRAAGKELSSPRTSALALRVGLDWTLKQKQRCSSCPCCHKTWENQGRLETEEGRMKVMWELQPGGAGVDWSCQLGQNRSEHNSARAGGGWGGWRRAVSKSMCKWCLPHQNQGKTTDCSAVSVNGFPGNLQGFSKFIFLCFLYTVLCMQSC